MLKQQDKQKKITKYNLFYKYKELAVIFIVLFFISFIYFGVPILLSTSFSAGLGADDNSFKKATVVSEDDTPVFVATHIKTPDPLKGIYMTSWVAGTPSFRKKLINLIDTTELNAVVIDIKDYTGNISFDIYNKKIDDIGSEDIRIPDLRDFIEELHSKNIYVIGRISVFQDPYIVSIKPEEAVKKLDNTEIWRDYKGLSWVDVGSTYMWDYIVDISRGSYEAGFDELNFDYIRFPSDGNMNDIYYPFSENKILNDPDLGKAKVLENFFSYLNDKLSDTGAVLSADLFGMTTTNKDDLNIGQLIEKALPYFDYISPMVYPSHYPTGFIGIAKPATKPYDVVSYSMSEVVKRINNFKNSTSTPASIRDRINIQQIRPWLQDFNLGAIYTPAMVRAQIDAVYDNGLTSWLMWDAGNTYTKNALIQDKGSDI